MAKGYQFKCDHGDGCGMKEYKSHDHLGADYVLATDYAALEAERDEWKRRIDDILGECCGTRDVCARTIIAIAEGGYNG